MHLNWVTPKRPLPLYKRLRRFPQRPRFLESLIAKLQYEKSGDLKTAYQSLSQIAESSNDDPLLLPKLKKELYAIKAMIDLNCLNSGGESCQLLDYNGRPYIKRNGKYEAIEAFAPFKIHKKKER